MEKENKIDELKKKLDFLISQQASFSSEIEEMKKELEDISSGKIVFKSSSSPIVEVKKEETQEYPLYYSLSAIKVEVKYFKEGKTKSGASVIDFQFKRNGKIYVAKMATNGNWLLQDKKDVLIARGKFSNNGLTMSLLENQAEGKEITGQSVIETLVEIAGLDSETKTRLTPQEENANEEVGQEKLKNLSNDSITSKDFGAQALKKKKSKSDLERIIGENLISIIGVLVILVGVVIGVKYAIDHGMINPLTRIVLAYVLGLGILFGGFKLKAKYEKFSAILVSGAMAIMYFVTFAAHNFYQLIPQLATFSIMVIFTLFLIVAAINYNRQIIAHIGLVGSYAIPFLLSDGSGNVAVLFTYMAILNAGILILAFKRNWKPLYYVAFGATYLIFGSWFLLDYRNDIHFYIGFGFAAIYYIMFYVTFLAYKLIEKEQFAPEDIMMISINSAIYYGIGYACLDQNLVGRNYVGLFTLGVAISHFIVSVIVFKQKLADRKLFYLSSVMVLIFITIAIPVQLDGNHVTLLWGAEAALLFWVGRTKGIAIYERLAYTVMCVALISTANDWVEFTKSGGDLPILNMTLFTSLFMIASFVYITYINSIEEYVKKKSKEELEIIKVLRVILPTIAVALTTILIPIHFDGNHVTLLLGGEVALLFWMGRTKQVGIFELLSYMVMIVSLSSMCYNWSEFYAYWGEPNGSSIVNMTFLTTLFMILCFGFITYINRKEEYENIAINDNPSLVAGLNLLFPAIVIAITYSGILMELNFYFSQLYDASIHVFEEPIKIGWRTHHYIKDADILTFRTIWNINYSLIFFTLLTILGIKKFKDIKVLRVILAINGVLVLAFLSTGLYELSELRQSFLEQPFADVFEYSSSLIVIRYISLAILGGMIYASYKLINTSEVLAKKDNPIVVLAYHIVFLWILSSELINILSLMGSAAEYKLGLSILWGLYSFVLVGVGIWKRTQFLRIIAMSLFGIVLLKLFFYDIASASTISKTIVFISLGLILVFVSFLYNKYKDRINEEN